MKEIKWSEHCKCKELEIVCKCDEECYIIDGRMKAKCPLCNDPLYSADTQGIHLSVCLSGHYMFDYCYQHPNGIYVNGKHFDEWSDPDIFEMWEQQGNAFIKFLAAATDEEIKTIRLFS